MVDIAKYEYKCALRRLYRLRDYTANLPRRSFQILDPSVGLAELELKTAASILKHIIDLRANIEVKNASSTLERMIESRVENVATEPVSAPPSPTYLEFSDIPPFNSRPATPVYYGSRRSPEPDSLPGTPHRLSATHQSISDILFLPNPSHKLYSVVVGRHTGV